MGDNNRDGSGRSRALPGRDGGMEGGIQGGGGGVGRRWPPVVEREAEGAERSGRAFFVRIFSSDSLQPELCASSLCKQSVQGLQQQAVSSRALSEVCFSVGSPVRGREREKEEDRSRAMCRFFDTPEPKG